MNDSKIILVGNGPSVLLHDAGEVIDGFDEVVRFNNFEIQGYQMHVGTRTDILCRRACDDVKMWPGDMFKRILCFVTYCQHTAGMTIVAQDMKRRYGNKLEIVPPNITQATGALIGLRQPDIEWASCGVLAIDYFARRYKHVVIHGFDGLNLNGEENVAHYYPLKPKDSKFHSGAKETAFIQELIEQGKVSRLV